MAKKKHSEMPGFWSREISRAGIERQKIASEYEWKKLKEIHNTGGSHVTVATGTDRQSIAPVGISAFVNWIFAYAQTFVPAVYWRHPKVIVEPKKSAFIDNAKIAALRINASFEQTNFRKQALLVVNDVLFFGIGWMKLGWFTQFGQVPPGAVPPDFNARGESNMDYESFLVKNEPYAYRISPEMVYVDPEAATIEEARWVVQEYYRPLEAVQDDPYMKHTDSIAALQFKSGGEDHTTTRHPPFVSETKKQWARIWEIWDREDNKVRFLCDGSDKFNRVIKPWPYDDLRGFPFEPLTFTEAIDRFYPPSVVLPWLPLVEELAFIRTTRLDHIARMVNKYVTAAGFMSDDEKRDFLDQDHELVEISGNPQDIQEFRGLQPDPQLYAAEDKVKEDIREISGFSELLSGSVPYSRISATTSAIMEKHSTLRFDHASELVGNFITNCAKKLFVIVRQHQSYPDEVRITGETGEVWREYTEQDLEGEFFFSIQVEDMGMISRQQRVKDAYDALSALAPFPEVNKWPLLRDLIVAFGKDDYEEYLMPEQGPPLDPSFENEMMAQGIPIRPNPKEDFQTHLMVHQQFMQSPAYQAQLQLLPQIGPLFSEHVQLTLRMAERFAQENVGPKPGVTPSIQQGGALAGSQPLGGAGNTAGPAGSNPMAQAMGQMIGR